LGASREDWREEAREVGPLGVGGREDGWLGSLRVGLGAVVIVVGEAVRMVTEEEEMFFLCV